MAFLLDTGMATPEKQVYSIRFIASRSGGGPYGGITFERKSYRDGVWNERRTIQLKERKDNSLKCFESVKLPYGACAVQLFTFGFALVSYMTTFAFYFITRMCLSWHSLYRWLRASIQS